MSSFRLSKALQPVECFFKNLPEKRASRWGESLTAEKMEQCHWVKPKLVCQVAFLEWTDAGHLRHCTFVAMRDDKKPAEVVREPTSCGSIPAGCASLTAWKQRFK
jgi:ATP-dependent DNA ligase